MKAREVQSLQSGVWLTRSLLQPAPRNPRKMPHWFVHKIKHCLSLCWLTGASDRGKQRSCCIVESTPSLKLGARSRHGASGPTTETAGSATSSSQQVSSCWGAGTAGVAACPSPRGCADPAVVQRGAVLHEERFPPPSVRNVRRTISCTRCCRCDQHGYE